MSRAARRRGERRWRHLLRPTVRLRLTVVYGLLFLACGAGLLALTYFLVRRGVPEMQPALIVRDVDPERGAVLAPLPDDIRLPDGRSLNEMVSDSAGELRAQMLRTLLVGSAVALGLMTVVCFALGWVMAGRVLRPLQSITARARRLGSENLGERIRLRGPADELKELADTFDAMLGRLDEAFESQRRFVANASHELRTPLAIVRTEVDVTLRDPDAPPDRLRGMGETVRAATIRAERLVDSLLLLARSERGPAQRTDVDLAVSAGDAIDEASLHAQQAGVTVEAELAAAPVRGDASLLERLVGNLVENGILHNRPGGTVWVSTGTRDGRAYVNVRNTGPVIPPGEVDSLFDPFRRLGRERTGSSRGVGLGLSIVRAIAAAHDGGARAAAQPQGGLDVTVELPLSTRTPALQPSR